MSKERFLTILVPIKSTDVEATYANEAALISAVPPSASNVNKIYGITDGTYRRAFLNISTSLYEYRQVVDREFPHIGKPIEIYDFTYDATRMGSAPTISAQNVMWFAETDLNGKDVTLDGRWSSDCHVTFNGENFYLKQIPTSGKSNEDARYKYDLDFVAERDVLEHVYLYDVVQPFYSERHVSESCTFSFYGDVNELTKRINASLIKSGLATLTRKYVTYPNNPSTTVPYLTSKQWNTVNVDPSSLVGAVFSNQSEMSEFKSDIYIALGGDYNIYLMDYVYENTNGVYPVNGYQCVIGVDKEGNMVASEEKLISFDKNTVHEALQKIHDEFELQYYIHREKDGNGSFTGNTLIMIDDCEHDFADWDEEGYSLLVSQPSDWTTNYSNYYWKNGNKYVALIHSVDFEQGKYYSLGGYERDDDGIPMTESPFDYGVTEEFLSKEKTNTGENVVTRITGVGSSENIPWYYPNPTADGWIKPIYKIGGDIANSVDIDYPTSEGSTASDNARYEKYLKNRIGKTFKRGVVKGLVFGNEYSSANEGGNPTLSQAMHCRTVYPISTNGIQYPRLALELYYNPYASGCNRVVASLLTEGTTVATYDSSETYIAPDDFQKLFVNKDGSTVMELSANTNYVLDITYSIPIGSVPNSSIALFQGYHYAAQDVAVQYEQLSGVIHYPNDPPVAHLGEDFYRYEGLVPVIDEEITVTQGNPTKYTHKIKNAGYSTNGEVSGIVSPIPRSGGVKYKDATYGTVYKCNTSTPNDWATGTPTNPFTANPNMKPDEWLKAFVQMKASVYDNDGWYLDSDKVVLSDYGIGSITTGGETFPADIFDTIEFQRQKYITPQSTLMPEVYIKTDGERRFYDAHNYEPLQTGTADTSIGEEQFGSYVINMIYKGEETYDAHHYEFESENIPTRPHEHIEDFEDVKPSIVGQRNTVELQSLRIDVVETFEYDLTDSNEIWESNDEGSIGGEYKHPYFFAKLRPMGFNIFDQALQEDMVVSMTTGNCGACNFKIGVDEHTKKNPVQVWEYDVYGGDTYETKGDKLYSAGELRRYMVTVGLYYNTNNTQGGYVPVDAYSAQSIAGGETETSIASVRMFESYTYSANDVANGFVGSLKQDGKKHFEGDVVTSGRFISSQQDTTENYVWVALMKDTETYGVIMPSAMQNHTNTNLDTYIRPKSITDVHTNGSSMSTDEDNADKFVLLNIKMPQVYLRRAEHELSRKLVGYMYEHNYQRFNFSIRFSRIYLAQNQSTDDNLNENAVLYVFFNGETYRQYVRHYSYRMSHDAVLPEITVELNDELPVTMSFTEQLEANEQRTAISVSRQIRRSVTSMSDSIAKTTVGKNDDVVINGNIVTKVNNSSLAEPRDYGDSTEPQTSYMSSSNYDDIVGKAIIYVTDDGLSDSADRSVSAPDYTLYSERILCVKYTNGILADSPTMSVNGLTAMPIYWHGASVLSGKILAGDTVMMVNAGGFYNILAIDRQIETPPVENSKSFATSGDVYNARLRWGSF